MWDRLSRPWQTAVQAAWTAYCAHSLPIGASIATPEGHIIAQGRNRSTDNLSDGDPRQLRQHFMAHAEENALITLGNTLRDSPVPADILARYTLYATLEPCAMCTGSIAISGIKTIHYLVPDPIGGATGVLNTIPQLQMHRIVVVGPDTTVLGNVMIAILFETQLRAGFPGFSGPLPDVLKPFAAGLQLGNKLAQSHKLEKFSKKRVSVATMYNTLAQQLGETH